jgi:hypothetical protein
MLAAQVVHQKREAAADGVECHSFRLVSNLGQKVALGIREFHRGMNDSWCLYGSTDGRGLDCDVVHDRPCFPASDLLLRCSRVANPCAEVLVLIAVRMVGSLIQLRGVGNDCWRSGRLQAGLVTRPVL